MSQVAEQVAPSAEPAVKSFTFEELKEPALMSKDNLHMLIHGKGAPLISSSQGFTLIDRLAVYNITKFMDEVSRHFRRRNGMRY